ncbi:MAG: glycoside hydrolase family 13 protein [Candidatus Azobacteroides sp.]|nr:glycoside hydrolase family 13 protein [Candidatus Azobacteroides sp.]
MKKILIPFILFCFSLSATALEITRMEPAFWWVGMKNPELQILVYGKDIARSDLQFEYPGVRLNKIVRVDNPDYLFIYLEIGKETKPGVMNLNFVPQQQEEGQAQPLQQTYELKARATTTGAQGFNPSDVLYLIMPDRFANGDPSNDVWDDEDIDRNEPFARHGGDLAGINAHLDYLRDLGVTAIWLNPVLENMMNSPEKYKSYHGYAITDFYRVDHRLGTNEEYCRLIENVHQRGMKIVMDMIFNHCGNRHWWMNNFPCNDWLNHQDGFVQTTHNLFTVMDVHAPQSEISGMTDGWFVPAMPDLNQRNPLLADYLIQNSIWWIEYARIDGIRHDTHPYADFDFLAEWVRRVFEEYPDFNIVGESWYAAGAPLAWWQRNSKLNKKQTYLKTIMDFNLMTVYNQAFDPLSTDYNPWKRIYEVIAQDFIYEDLDNILVFLDNHDTSRFMKKDETNLNRYKQALAFLLTTRGIPQLYYGTEILMYGEKSEGDGMLRKDFPGGWKEDAVNAFTAGGRTSLQNEAFNYLQKLLQWRKTNPAVANGKLIHYVPDWETECYVYARIYNDNKVLVILNGSDKDQKLSPEKYREVIEDADSGKDIISNTIIDLKKEITIPAKGVYIIDLM